MLKDRRIVLLEGFGNGFEVLVLRNQSRVDKSSRCSNLVVEVGVGANESDAEGSIRLQCLEGCKCLPEKIVRKTDAAKVTADNDNVVILLGGHLGEG
jgi:hypothetical protein